MREDLVLGWAERARPIGFIFAVAGAIDPDAVIAAQRTVSGLVRPSRRQPRELPRHAGPRTSRMRATRSRFSFSTMRRASRSRGASWRRLSFPVLSVGCPGGCLPRFARSAGCATRFPRVTRAGNFSGRWRRMSGPRRTGRAIAGCSGCGTGAHQCRGGEDHAERVDRAIVGMKSRLVSAGSRRRGVRRRWRRTCTGWGDLEPG